MTEKQSHGDMGQTEGQRDVGAGRVTRGQAWAQAWPMDTDHRVERAWVGEEPGGGGIRQDVRGHCNTLNSKGCNKKEPADPRWVPLVQGQIRGPSPAAPPVPRGTAGQSEDRAPTCSARVLRQCALERVSERFSARLLPLPPHEEVDDGVDRTVQDGWDAQDGLDVEKIER